MIKNGNVTKGNRVFRCCIVVLITCSFIANCWQLPAYAQISPLPLSANMIGLTEAQMPLTLKGLVVHSDNALKFDFIMDTGESQLDQGGLKDEALKIMKYFLTSLTVPEQDLWVNLSPYENQKIVDKSFGQTRMGRDLLTEDYVLKQLTASLIYPESELGKKFWSEVYKKAQEKFGTTQVPIHTFNKVWIVPSQAVVWENEGKVMIVKSSLKVMLEEDFLSLQKHQEVSNIEESAIGSQIVREIVIPTLEKEVNTGKHFAQLRQMYQAMILATWYKKALKESLLTKIYADQKKIKGIDGIKEKEVQDIYQDYIKAFKKGAFNYIKEDLDPVSGKSIPRKYFSGGFSLRSGLTSFLMSLMVWGAVLTVDQQQAVAQTIEPVGSLVVVEGALIEAVDDQAISQQTPVDLNELLVQVSNPNSPQRRSAAAQAFLQLPDQEAVKKALLNLLASKDRFSKNGAAEALGRVFNWDFFKTQLMDGGIDIDQILAEVTRLGYSIQDLNNPTKFNQLMGILKKTYPEYSKEQWAKLEGALKSQIQTVVILVRALRDGDSDVRAYAAQALSRVVGEGLRPLVIGELIAALKDAENRRYDHQGLKDLFIDWDQVAVPFLKKAVEDAKDPEDVGALMDILDQWGWRYNRAKKEWRQEEKAKKVFLDTTTRLYGQTRIRVRLNPENSYEAAADEVTNQLGISSEYGDILLAYFQDYGSAQEQVIDVTDLIQGLMDQDSLETLKSEDPQQRSQAAKELINIKERQLLILPTLLTRLKEGGRFEKNGAAEALGEIFSWKVLGDRLKAAGMDLDRITEEIVKRGDSMSILSKDQGKLDDLIKQLRKIFPQYSDLKFEFLTRELRERFGAVGVLLSAINDGLSDVRSYAAEALGKVIGDKLGILVLPDLIEELKNAVKNKQDTTGLIKLISGIGEEAVPLLKKEVEATEDPDLIEALIVPLEEKGWRYKRQEKLWIQEQASTDKPKGILQSASAAALEKPETLGGISLDASFLRLEMKGGSTMMVSQEFLNSIHIQGFRPFIIHIKPMSDSRSYFNLPNSK